jgi:PhnB protein
MPDPFDALRRPSGPVPPPPQFAAALRRRLEAALVDLVPPDPVADAARSTVDLGSRKDTPMSQTDTSAPSPSTPTPDPLVGVTSIQPYLSVRDGLAAIEFYKEAFGAVVDNEVMMPDGRVGHAELKVGTGAAFALADEYPEMEIVGPATLGNTSVSISLVVPDADASVARAAAAGATIEREVADQFYGARSGVIRDPFGHRWFIQTPTESLTAEEIRRRAAAGEDER